jgi:CheY-like chemotaxis protein
VRSTALLVNVHKSEQKVLQHFLIQAGYRVLLSDTSDEALELCRDYKGKIHLLVSDAEVPGSSGWELAERATMLRPGILILYLSGSFLRGKSLGPKSQVARTQALKKATLLFDVTQVLIHKAQEKIQ